MDFELSIINGRTVSDIIRARRGECVEIVRGAYLAHARGQSVNPDSYFLRFPDKPDCRIIALPAYLGDGFDVAGLKWIASYPGNVQRGFPRASAVLVLNCYDTGYPFAILESSIISAARTAASAVLAAYTQSLARHILNDRPFEPQRDVYTLYNYNRFQACRYGLDGKIANAYTQRHVTLKEDILETLAVITPHAAELGNGLALAKLPP